LKAIKSDSDSDSDEHKKGRQVEVTPSVNALVSPTLVTPLT